MALGLALTVAGACDKKPDANAADTAAAATGSVAATGSTAATGSVAATGTPLAATGPAADTAKANPSKQIMAYLDPGARAVLITRVSQDFDPEVLGTVMALPPGATRLLESRHRVLDGLEASTGESLEELSAWLGPDMMVMTPQASGRDYVVSATALDETKLAPKLEAAGMQKSVLDGKTYWLPTRSFGFKVTLLEPGLLAFIPMQEMGSGMGPLNAGRDKPASKMREQLDAMLGDDPAIAMALHAGGPMLHLDLHGDVTASQLGLRRAEKGYDAQVVLQPVAPLDEAAKVLAAREHPEETQQVQALMKRVKFIVDREALIGEVHLSDDDFELLQ